MLLLFIGLICGRETEKATGVARGNSEPFPLPGHLPVVPGSRKGQPQFKCSSYILPRMGTVRGPEPRSPTLLLTLPRERERLSEQVEGEPSRFSRSNHPFLSLACSLAGKDTQELILLSACIGPTQTAYKGHVHEAGPSKEDGQGSSQGKDQP